MDPGFFLTYLNLGMVYEAQGRYEEALAAYQEATALSDGDPGAQSLLGHAYAASGHRNEAQKVLNALTEDALPFHAAIIYIGLGEHDRALELLEQAYEERFSLMTVIGVIPHFDPLRSDPRFDALLAKVGLTDY